MNRKCENIWLFLFRKNRLSSKKKKNSIIVQQGELATLATWNDNGVFGTRRSHPDPVRLFFFSIPKPIPFKNLNGTGWFGWDEKIFKLVPFTFDFYFIFFIILKLICFIKNKNIMNFYKLFIKKHFNYYYYLY